MARPGVRNVDHDGVEAGEAFQRQCGQILPIGPAMERRIDIRPCIRHHLDLADLELNTRSVMRSRGLSDLNSHR